MPLFKSKKKSEGQGQSQTSTTQHQDPNYDQREDRQGRGVGVGGDPNANTYAGGRGVGVGGDPNAANYSTGGVGSGGGLTGQDHSGVQVPTATHQGDANRAAGTGQGYNEGTTHGHHHHHTGGGVNRMEGRAEQKFGDLVGSRALQAQGVQKDREAGAIKAQGAEIAEAERLEQEASVHRERAVASGAHPANKHLGAGWRDNGGGDQRY